MSDHPALEQILDRVLGRGLYRRDRRASDRLRELPAGLGLGRGARQRDGGGPPVVAPETVIERVSIPFDEPRRHTGRERWSIARLVEDAFARPILAGVRGSASARRMLYELPDGQHR